MAGSLGSLVVSMAVDTARFQGDLGRAAAITERRMKNIRDTAQRAMTALTLAATAAGAALVAMVTRNLNAADQMRELAMAVGTTTEELSGLVEAASRSGLSQDQIVTGMKRLSANAIDAAKGVGEAAEAFKALGINVKREDGTIKASGELIREMADRFSKAPDGITKTALAMAAFGKEGANWIPFLNEGSAKIDGLIERLKAMGVVISEETGVAADQFNDNLKDLKDLSSGFGRLLTAELAPSLANVTGELVRGSQGFDTLKASAEFFADFVRVIVSGLLIVKHILSELGKTIGGLAAAFMAAARGDFKQAWDILGEISEDGAKEHEKFITQLLDVWDKTAQQTSAAAPQLGEQLAAPAKAAAKQTKEAVEEMERFLNQATQMANDAARFANGGSTIAPDVSENTAALASYFDKINAESGAASRRVMELGEGFKEVDKSAKGVAETLKDESLRQGFTAMSDLIYGMGDGMDDFAESTLNAFKRILANAITQQLFEILGGLGNGGKDGGFLGFIGGLFSGFAGARAGGGPVSAGKSYLVGERGAEMFRPSSSGWITPNSAMASGPAYAPVNYYHIDSRTDRAAIRQDMAVIAEETNRRGFEQFRDYMSRGGR